MGTAQKLIDQELDLSWKECKGQRMITFQNVLMSLCGDKDMARLLEDTELAWTGLGIQEQYPLPW